MTNITFIAIDEPSQHYLLNGEWNTANLSELNYRCQRILLHLPPHIQIIDAQHLKAFDTSGALILYKLISKYQKQNKSISLINFKEEYRELYELIVQRLESQPPHEAPRKQGLLENLGKKTWEHLIQAQLLLAFVGEMAMHFVAYLINPKKIRWPMVWGHIEEIGVNALPIVGLLSFLLGVVIGYQGGTQLRDYGANIFVVELVSLTMLRELAPMMTAVIIAGRSGSAFTAQIGTMKVTEEISAMKTMGMSPFDILVLPRTIAMMIALPLLIMFADIMGVLGGMVMASSMLDVSYYDFFQRLPDVVSVNSFLIGIGKAPVFALIIAVVGCFQGFQVTGSGESVGRQTTVSVVQATFILILADAIFSIVFSLLEI